MLLGKVHLPIRPVERPPVHRRCSVRNWDALNRPGWASHSIIVVAFSLPVGSFRSSGSISSLLATCAKVAKWDPPGGSGHLRTFRGGAAATLLTVGMMKEIYEMKGARSIREIARELDISRNTVRRYLKSPEAMRPKPRPPRGSNLDPYTEHLENCVVLHRSKLGVTRVVTRRSVVRPKRQWRQPEATMRFETGPGEQAQVDCLPYIIGSGCS